MVIKDMAAGSLDVNITYESEDELESIQDITSSVHGLWESAIKQSDSMNEVTRAVEQIATVIQSTSATAEESSAISEELFAQSESLNGMIDQFQFDKS